MKNEIIELIEKRIDELNETMQFYSNADSGSMGDQIYSNARYAELQLKSLLLDIEKL